jgi:hypothetical protein
VRLSTCSRNWSGYGGPTSGFWLAYAHCPADTTLPLHACVGGGRESFVTRSTTSLPARSPGMLNCFCSGTGQTGMYMRRDWLFAAPPPPCPPPPFCLFLFPFYRFICLFHFPFYLFHFGCLPSLARCTLPARCLAYQPRARPRVAPRRGAMEPDEAPIFRWPPREATTRPLVNDAVIDDNGTQERMADGATREQRSSSARGVVAGSPSGSNEATSGAQRVTSASSPREAMMAMADLLANEAVIDGSGTQERATEGATRADCAPCDRAVVIEVPSSSTSAAGAEQWSHALRGLRPDALRMIAVAPHSGAVDAAANSAAGPPTAARRRDPEQSRWTSSVAP